MLPPRLLKLLAIGYVVKTFLLGAAWLAVPNLPERAAACARQAWSRIAGSDAVTP